MSQQPRENKLLSEAVCREAELELLCTQCGLCCHMKVPLPDGTFAISPKETCEFLGSDCRCTVYEQRFEKCPTCLNRDQMIARDYVLPETCSYIKLRGNYKPAKVMTEDEILRIFALQDFFQAIDTKDDDSPF